MKNCSIVVDISGKVLNYDRALCDALVQNGVNNLYFISPIRRGANDAFRVFSLIKLVPKVFQNSDALPKRVLKAVEGLLNYILLLLFLMVHKVNVVHMQWLPFLEVIGIEYYFLVLMRKVSPGSRFVLTIHNIYPHDMSPSGKQRYKQRFQRVAPLFDKFIVHTNNSRQEVENEFGLPNTKIEVVNHGIFMPKNVVFSKKVIDVNNWNLIMYGNQSPYKGTDILVKALSLLADDIKKKVHVTICGQMSQSYYESLLSVETGVDLRIIPFFIKDSELYNMISDSDIILLPYRSISQSGVLLLALPFKKAIITSDLPTFKETLRGFSDDMFFKYDNPQSFADTITNYINGQVDINRQLSIIEGLLHDYTWDESAKKTKRIYMN